MATPADPCSEKIFFFVLILGGEKLLEKRRYNIFKRPERGLIFVGHVSNRFSDLVSLFQTIFRVKLNLFRVSFVLQACRPEKLSPGNTAL